MLQHHFLCHTFIFAYLISHKFSVPSNSAQYPICSSYPTTATAQFAEVYTIFCLVISNLILVLLLVLSVSLLSVLCQWLTALIYYTALWPIAHHMHMFALTETWITPFTTSAELLDCVPTGYSLLNLPRSACPNDKNKIMVEILLFMFMILVKFSSVLLLFLNHLTYPLSLLLFLNLDLQYSVFIIVLPHLPRLFLSQWFSNFCLVGSYHFPGIS
jgi:hypothetical protein